MSEWESSLPEAQLQSVLIRDDQGNLRVQVRMRDQVVLDIPELHEDFESLVDVGGLRERVSLLRMEHDLDAECECLDCQRVKEIRDELS